MAECTTPSRRFLMFEEFLNSQMDVHKIFIIVVKIFTVFSASV